MPRDEFIIDVASIMTKMNGEVLDASSLHSIHSINDIYITLNQLIVNVHELKKIPYMEKLRSLNRDQLFQSEGQKIRATLKNLQDRNGFMRMLMSDEDKTKLRSLLIKKMKSTEEDFLLDEKILELDKIFFSITKYINFAMHSAYELSTVAYLNDNLIMLCMQQLKNTQDAEFRKTFPEQSRELTAAFSDAQGKLLITRKQISDCMALRLADKNDDFLFRIAQQINELFKQKLVDLGACETKDLSYQFKLKNPFALKGADNDFNITVGDYFTRFVEIEEKPNVNIKDKISASLAIVKKSKKSLLSYLPFVGSTIDAAEVAFNETKNILGIIVQPLIDVVQLPIGFVQEVGEVLNKNLLEPPKAVMQNLAGTVSSGATSLIDSISDKLKSNSDKDAPCVQVEVMDSPPPSLLFKKQPELSSQLKVEMDQTIQTLKSEIHFWQHSIFRCFVPNKIAGKQRKLDKLEQINKCSDINRMKAKTEKYLTDWTICDNRSRTRSIFVKIKLETDIMSEEVFNTNEVVFKSVK